MERKNKIIARWADFARGLMDEIEIYVVSESGGSVTHVAERITLSPVERGEHCPPTITIQRHEAQGLMDDLWECGMRPSEGTGSIGSLAATQRHLADIKTILFKKLGIESKG